MRRRRISRYALTAVVLLCGCVFVARFAGPALLRLYIESGVGRCQEIPILCMEPSEEISDPPIDKDYIASELLAYQFPGMVISVPRGFNVVQERIKKVYYKKRVLGKGQPVVYLLHENPDFFVNLFPQIKKEGIGGNYEFIARTMQARLNSIKTLNDAFFVIVKGIFIPYLGEQRSVRMIKFKSGPRRGRINYNLGKVANYFDCNVIDKEGDFFKVYIKDEGARLDLEKVLAIISTLKKP